MLAPMKAQRLASAFVAASLAGSLAACSDPQTPASTTGTPATATATATAASTSVATAAPSATAAPDSADKLPEPYTLTYVQTGGIAGLHMELVVDTAAKKISYAGLRNNQPQSKDLTPDDLAPLSRALEEARYATFHGPLKGTPFPDAFSYALTLKAAGKDYNVSWTDGTTVPAPLAAVRSALAKLRDAKFPTKATSPGAPDK